MRRRPIGGGAVVLLALLALGGCGGSAGSPAVSRAAAATARAPGFRFAVSLEGAGAGQAFSVHGEGALSQPGRAGHLDLVWAGRATHEILAGGDVYVQAAPLNPGGARWLRVDLGTMIQALGAGAALASAGPAQTLDLLRAADAGSQVGHAVVGGASTTAYRVTADLRRFVSLAAPSLRADAARYDSILAGRAGQRTVPVEVWIDHAGRVRRVRLKLSACAGSRRMTETATVEYFDFGPQVPVTPPAASQVTDVSGSLAAAVAAARRATGC